MKLPEYYFEELKNWNSCDLQWGNVRWKFRDFRMQKSSLRTWAWRHWKLFILCWCQLLVLPQYDSRSATLSSICMVVDLKTPYTNIYGKQLNKNFRKKITRKSEKLQYSSIIRALLLNSRETSSYTRYFFLGRLGKPRYFLKLLMHFGICARFARQQLDNVGELEAGGSNSFWGLIQIKGISSLLSFWEMNKT